jgi:hypothetical protein
MQLQILHPHSCGWRAPSMAFHTHRLVDDKTGTEGVVKLHTVKQPYSKNQLLAIKAAASLQGSFKMKHLPTAESPVYPGSDKQPAIKQICDAVETMYDSNVAKW